MNENSPVLLFEQDRRAESARCALAFAGEALLDNAATEVGIDQTLGGSPHDLAKVLIGDFVSVSKSRERPILEDTHSRCL